MSNNRFDGRILEIQSVFNRRCLNVAGGDRTDGADIQLWDDNLGTNEHNRWRIEELQPGIVEIISEYSNKCLNLCAGNLEEGASVVLWGPPGSSNPHNRWSIHETRSGVYEIQSLYSGRFLSVEHGGSDFGSRVVLCNDRIGQSTWNEWWIHPSPYRSDSHDSDNDEDVSVVDIEQEISVVCWYALMNAYSGKALDNPPSGDVRHDAWTDDSICPDDCVLVWELHGDYNQSWCLLHATHPDYRDRYVQYVFEHIQQYIMPSHVNLPHREMLFEPYNPLDTIPYQRILVIHFTLTKRLINPPIQHPLSTPITNTPVQQWLD